MVESKNKTSTARAKIAHKLAKYVRATPIHLTGIHGNNQPSASHLSIFYSIQLSEELPREDSETKLIHGILLMTKDPSIKEPPKSLKLLKEENQSLQEQLLSYFLVLAEEEE